MKNSPDHIESVTCEDEVRCAVLSQFFSTQVIIFLKGEEVGQPSVPAEILNSNELASVARILAPLH